MIPVKLSLSNFMSYGQAELSFAGIHTACLTGNNGNGKSAILDAITWALWGQARGVDKNGAGMDDLVRMGNEEMAVEFTFDLDGQVYRILRKRDKRRQVSSLELQIQAEQGFRSLTGDRLSQTQDKITQVLKLDYETFTNSAFVLQGQADAFTTQKASDRKRILGEILGLTYYDRLERKSRDKMNQADYSLKEIDRSLEQLAGELSQEGQVRLEWEAVKSEKLAVDATLERNELQLQELTERLAEFQGMQKKKSELDERVRQAKNRTGEIKHQAEVLAAKLLGLREILAREAEIAAGYQRLQQTQVAEEEMNLRQARSMELFRTKHSLETQLGLERNKLEKELAALESQKSVQLKILARAKQAIQELDVLNLEKCKLEAQVQERTELQQETLKLQGGIAERQALLRALEEELKELRERFKTVHLAEAQCPLCLGALDQAQKDALLVKLTAEGKEKREREARIKSELTELTNSIQANEKKISALGSEKLAQIQAKLELSKRDANEGEQAGELLQALQQRELALHSALEQQVYAPELQKELDRVQQELSQLNYDQDNHSQLRGLLKELAFYRDKYADLKGAKDTLPQDEELFQQLQRQQEREHAEVVSHQETIVLLDTQLIRLPELQGEFVELKEKVSRQREEKSRLDSRHGALEQKILHLGELKRQREEKLTQREDTAKTKQLYSELVTAFGKKGIQAMIIENAVPELQEEANALLSRMTDGRMHLTLLTQRDNKKGGVVETLDIRIGDELGTRKYEMFSGGEAFRVNFALRIALSKLLARRAGAKLQTLVIDEGFGTQDGKGKERLIEVINAIKNDFAKIIIVTHIQELKDAFPVQIEVEKTADGSSLAFV
jgi:DNA repair protein SbcC/Rad50